MQALRLVSVVLSTAAIFCCAHSHAQTIDRVDVFRDAAVVTWRTQARPGPCPVARSFHAVMPSDVLVFDEADAPPRGGAQGEEVKWFDTGGEARFEAADKALKSARLELELKRAQLELVEEDLALLRANRKVGGTSESLLVEDLELMVDWMHEEAKDRLFRRVELKAEIEDEEKEYNEMREARDAAAPRSVFRWSVDLPAGASGEVWTQVVEWGGQQRWTPADVLSLNSGASPELTWHRRADVLVDLPWGQGEVSMRFHDADYAGLSERPDARPLILDGAVAYGAPRKSYEAAARTDASTWPGVGWTVERGLNPGAMWRKSISLGDVASPVQVRHHAVPAQHAAVNMRLSIPRPSEPVAAAEQALLMVDGRPVGKVWLTERGDSIVMDAGVARDWTVVRAREAALCSKSVLGGKVKHHRAYRITVTNRSAADGDFVLDEPLPVSRTAEIEVIPESLDGGTLDEASGILRWTFALAAGQSRTVQFSYDLSHGKGQVIPGFE